LGWDGSVGEFCCEDAFPEYATSLVLEYSSFEGVRDADFTPFVASEEVEESFLSGVVATFGAF
jgi:hypothetical protein